MSEQPIGGPVVPLPSRKIRWWRVLFIGLVLFIVSMVILLSTGNPKLFPVTALLGSLAVPVAYVVFFYEHRQLSHLSLAHVASSYYYGGTLAVLLAALLEPLLLRELSAFSLLSMGPAQGYAAMLKVGLIEEFLKGIVLAFLVLHRRHTSQMNGLILGAAVGMGFSTLENLGYAFASLLQSHGNLPTVFNVVFIRGLLSPIGHGTWTAILGAVLFRESRPGEFRFDMRVVLAYLAVSLLHGSWDGIPVLVFKFRLPLLSHVVAAAVVGAAGIVILWAIWHEARRRQITQFPVSEIET